MSETPTTDFRPIGLLLGAAFPGAGHMATGQVSRGILVAVGVLGLFFGGMFIGGIDIVDGRENKVWFIGQALIGPVAFGVDWVHQNKFKAYDASVIATTDDLAAAKTRSANPDEVREVQTIRLIDSRTSTDTTRTIPVFRRLNPGEAPHPPNATSVAKVNELGTLFATVGGMLNLIAILDAGFPGRPKKKSTEPKEVGA